MCPSPPLLVSLPAELQIKVVEELYEHHACPYEEPLAQDAFLENIKAVRLTCKSLNAAASDIFLKTWFSHRSIIFERKSLLNLYKIATTPPFNKRLYQVEIAVYEFLPELCGDFKTFHDRMEREARDESCFLRHDHIKEHFLGDHERNANWPRARAAYEAYKQYTDDQTELYSRFVHVRLLARAFKALSGTIRTISVNGAQTPLTGAWSRGILQECGISLLHKEKIARHPTTMNAVLRAIHLSDVDFCTLAANGLNVSALELSLPQRRRFSEIGYSHLHHINLRLLDPKTFPLETNAAIFRAGLLHNFIQQAHNLMNLSIEFYNNPYDISLDKLLGSRIEKLESLSLGGMTFHAQDLIEWLTENKSKLVHLQIDYSSLITGSWRDVFRQLRSNLDLKTVYFHFLADDEESIHITGENVNNFILKKSSKVDWETMESKILPRNMADLAGLFSVVVNGHPHHHHHPHHAHHHHDHHHGGDGAGPTPGSENADNQGQAQVNHPVAGPAPPADNQNNAQGIPVMVGPALPLDHPSIPQVHPLVDYFAAGMPGFPPSAQNEAQGNPVVAGPAPPPGHPASQPSVTLTNGDMALPMPPPHLMNAMQNLFQNALGVTLDFLDNLDEEEDELSDSLTLDDDDFNDDEDLDDDSETEDDEDEVDDDDDNVRRAEEGYAEGDDDGYKTDDSGAEEILDRIVKGL